MELRHQSTKLTAAEILALPEDGLRHELIDGVHYVTPTPIPRHQRIAGRLFYAIQSYLNDHPIGEVFGAPLDTVLGTHDVVEPDLIYVSHERSRKFLTEKNMQGAPDLVVEILSPGTKRRDLTLKRDLYDRAGVLEYWIVDPVGNTVTIYRRGRGRFDPPVTLHAHDALTTPLLPGLTVPLDKIFA